ncbi:MAG: two pore domain potassium channel family protein [Simkaniaceae bacterium]|nr:MAG: two pore domain potassium channel family protein [Simkaniaceae bacterium]
MANFFKKSYSSCVRSLSGYFTQLLISLILLFVFRPYDRGGIYMAVWQLFLVIVFLSAIFNCDHSKKIKIVSTCFAVPALIFQWLNLGFHSRTLTLLFLFFSMIFIFIMTASIIKKVVINARVRLETLKGVVCAYFMVAFGFSFAYFFIALLLPHSFHFSNLNPAILSHSHFLSEMMYFSFVTLLCIGYGDVIAIRDIAQTLAILEGIIGQFYIAILVSRLVAVYSFFEHKLHLVSKKK